MTADAATVIGQIVDEAHRRDPDHQRTWVALVDGNRHQIDQITAQAATRGVTITILLDIVHVLEYLWAAAWCFFDEGEVAAEKWVAHQARRILQGHARPVATAIARKAQAADRQRRTKADACVTYLRNNAAHLDYPTALAKGWPIATGIIEGACRHLIADRLDITGARWSLDGAYWTHHLTAEHHRTHHSRYAHNTIPQAA
ncbi:hypothetical protein BH23ACT9_BH23ACT9_25010 [soil metagenome]